MPPETKPKKKGRLVNSFVWTDEEAKYLKAVLKWKEKEPAAAPSHSGDDDNSKQEGHDGSLLDPEKRAAGGQQKSSQQQQQQQKPAGEFRILVIGARGTGKTSILTRFATDTFPGEDEPPDPFYSRGCRHRIELDASAYQFSLPGQGQGQSLDSSPQPPSTDKNNGSSNSPMPITPTRTQTQQKRIYIVDALEMPSQHLPSDPMLEQALNLTEAGVLVYDVTDAKSLQLVVGIAEFVKEYLDKVNSSNNATGGGSSGTTTRNGNEYPRRREFPLILVGNKSDVGLLAAAADNDEDDDDTSTATTANEEEEGDLAAQGEQPIEGAGSSGSGLHVLKRTVPWVEGSKAAARITALSNTNSTNNGASASGGGILSPSLINPQGPVPFVEVSAKTGDNINVIFPMLARDILRYRWLFEQRQAREHRRQQQQQQQHQRQQVMLLRSSGLIGAAGGQSQGRLGMGMGYRGVGGGVVGNGITRRHDHGDGQNGMGMYNPNGKDSSSTEYSSSSSAGAAVDGARTRNGLKKRTFWRKAICCFGR